jgi:hypothetical protein
MHAQCVWFVKLILRAVWEKRQPVYAAASRYEFPVRHSRTQEKQIEDS